MDTARQVIRWSLPGWMAYFFFVIFITITFLVCGKDQQIYIALLKKANDFSVPLSIATIPLGFFVYQIYYWLYWYAPVPYFVGRFVLNPVDRGREILDAVKEQIDFKMLFDHPLNPTEEVYQPRKFLFSHLRCKSARVMQKYRENWHLSDSVWYFALADERYKSTAEFLEKRNQMIGDIYHSLGASYTALIIALFSYLALFAYVTVIEIMPCLSDFALLLSTGTPTAYLAGVLKLVCAVSLRVLVVTLNSAIFVAIFKVFNSGRMASFDALLSLKHDVITTVLLDKPKASEVAQQMV